MVDEYISRRAAEDAVRACCLEASACNLQCIKDIPAADVRPVVKARWKPVMCAGNPNIHERGEWYGSLFVCDKCNWTMIGESNFCSHCGAKMEG